MGSISPQNIHEAIIIHMINREEHRDTVMSIVIMGFVQYLRDKGVCVFAFFCSCVCARTHVCVCARMCVCTDMHAKCSCLDG